MITDIKKRIAIYVITFIAGLFWQVVNYLLYLFDGSDGGLLLSASILLPGIAVLFAMKLNGGQAMLAAALLSLSDLCMWIVDELGSFEVQTHGQFMYGLGWGISMLIWLVAPLLNQIIAEIIAIIVRKNRKKGNE